MNVKKALIITGAALVVFFLISQPVQAAELVKDILAWLEDGAKAIITFMKSVFNG